MKDKKKLGTALNSIISSLRKAYDLLSAGTDLPEIDNDALPRIANVLVKSLEREIAEIKENERFSDMSDEEIEEIREAEKSARIQKLQEDSAETFKKMCQERNPEPAHDPDPESDEDPEGDQDPDGDLDEDEDYEGDQDEDEDLEGDQDHGTDESKPGDVTPQQILEALAKAALLSSGTVETKTPEQIAADAANAAALANHQASQL